MAALNNGGEYNTSFPPGYRFYPNDHELITYYLKPKINNQTLPYSYLMHEVSLYDHDPGELTASYQAQGDEEWYFFTRRGKKYKNGNRPSRSAGKGYWKATGMNVEIKKNKNNQEEILGLKRSLSYFKGAHKKGTKTSWIMYEYWIEGNETTINNRETRKPSNNSQAVGSNDEMLDGWVLCKVYKIKRSQKQASESCTQTNNYDNKIFVQPLQSYQPAALPSNSCETSLYAQEDQPTMAGFQETLVEKAQDTQLPSTNNNIFHQHYPSHDNFDQSIIFQATPISIINQTLGMESMDEFWNELDDLPFDLSSTSSFGISSWDCFDELSAAIMDKK